jgi:hypothetical protein
MLLVREFSILIGSGQAGAVAIAAVAAAASSKLLLYILAANSPCLCFVVQIITNKLVNEKYLVYHCGSSPPAAPGITKVFQGPLTSASVADATAADFMVSVQLQLKQTNRSVGVVSCAGIRPKSTELHHQDDDTAHARSQPSDHLRTTRQNQQHPCMHPISMREGMPMLVPSSCLFST